MLLVYVKLMALAASCLAYAIEKRANVHYLAAPGAKRSAYFPGGSFIVNNDIKLTESARSRRYGI